MARWWREFICWLTGGHVMVRTSTGRMCCDCGYREDEGIESDG